MLTHRIHGHAAPTRAEARHESSAATKTTPQHLSNTQRTALLNNAVNAFGMEPVPELTQHVEPSRVPAAAKTGAVAALNEVKQRVHAASLPRTEGQTTARTKLYAVHASETDKTVIGYLACGGVNRDGSFNTFAIGVGLDGKRLVDSANGM